VVDPINHSKTWKYYQDERFLLLKVQRWMVFCLWLWHHG